MPIEQLLTRAAADNSASRQDRMLSLQLRLANCLRRQGDFPHALEMLRGVIAQKPKALDIQVAAATLLEDWGTSLDPGAELRSLDAIRGLHDPAGGGVVWGWAEIASRLERVLASGRADNELREKYFEARYSIPACRRQFAERTNDATTKAKALDVALGEINAFALVSADVSDDSWRRLDTLYQDIETDLGRKPTPLARPDLRTANAVAAAGTATPLRKPLRPPRENGTRRRRRPRRPRSNRGGRAPAISTSRLNRHRADLDSVRIGLRRRLDRGRRRLEHSEPKTDAGRDSFAWARPTSSICRAGRQSVPPNRPPRNRNRRPPSRPPLEDPAPPFHRKKQDPSLHDSEREIEIRAAGSSPPRALIAATFGRPVLFGPKT